jgi:hypothetical protein
MLPEVIGLDLLLIAVALAWPLSRPWRTQILAANA